MLEKVSRSKLRGRIAPSRSGLEIGVGASAFGLGAGADLSLALLVGGPERVIALVAFQVAMVAGVGLLALGVRSRRREVTRTRLARRTEEMAAHHRDLADYAHTMKLLLGQRETPWRTSAVYYQWQQHFPELIEPVNAWLKMVRAEQSNYFRAGPEWRQERAKAELGIQAIATGHIRGTCDRCREIEGEVPNSANLT